MAVQQQRNKSVPPAFPRRLYYANPLQSIKAGAPEVKTRYERSERRSVTVKINPQRQPRAARIADETEELEILKCLITEFRELPFGYSETASKVFSLRHRMAGYEYWRN